MQRHSVSVHNSQRQLSRSDELAWKIAAVAADRFQLTSDVVEVLINRVIDNFGVAAAAINREPVIIARSEALARPYAGGSTVFGLSNTRRFRAEWASWANTTAVRDLDMNDTFLAADYSHPADTIPALVALAQQCGKSGADLIRSIVTSYEIYIALVKGICLHEHRKDHVAHLAPALVAGIGTLLGLDIQTIYQALQQAVHLSFACRQARRGQISSWKSFAPAHVAKIAVEAVDHALRGGQGPSPIYEGPDGVIAAMLNRKATYIVELPERDEPRRAILESAPKEYSAEYHAQALVDLALRMRTRIPNLEMVKNITLHTSSHAHKVIGTGSGDPQKYDPSAKRETLDHSAMYVFAVSLEDGCLHHINSYLPERAGRESTKRLWDKVITAESSRWTQRYHESSFEKRAHGARAEIRLSNGKTIEEELYLPDAHPNGSRPFRRNDHIRKYRDLTDEIITDAERERLLRLAEKLSDLSPHEVTRLNFQVSDREKLLSLPMGNAGIL